MFDRRTLCLRTALRLVLAAISAVAGWDADAQDQPPTPIQEIVVTGSRIRTTNERAPEPITVVTAGQIRETKAISLEEFLTKLPSIDFNTVSMNDNNGGYGAAEAGLHELGSQRTLVLVDGYRYPATDTQGVLVDVDLNSIPLLMVDHIEILRDGASSTYGADAIAGVINVVMKKDFRGLDTQASFGSTDKNDGQQYQAAATLGIGRDDWNLTVNLTYDRRDPIKQADRAWASRQFLDANGQLIDPGVGPVSSRPPGLLLIDPNTGAEKYFGGAYNSYLLQPGYRFNTAIIPYLIGEEDRKQASLTGHYDITDDVTLVAEGFYTARGSTELLAPAPIDYSVATAKYPNGFVLPYCLYDDPNCAFGVNPNAILAGVTSDQLASTRRFEGGPRVYHDDVDTYQARVGLEGRFGAGYEWQLGYAYGRSDALYRTAGEVNYTHFLQLAGLVPCNGEPGCHVADFVGDNTLTPQDVAYATYTNIRKSAITQSYGYANVTGPVPLLPAVPAGPVKFSLGGEYRRESTFDNPDPVVVSGNGDINGAPTSGAYSVAAAYAELRAPLLANLPWAKALTLTGSTRYDHYDVFGGALTWKANVDYAPDDDVRLRITRATGLRAPSIKELYGGSFAGIVQLADPCDTQNAMGFAGSPACVRDLSRLGVNPTTFSPGMIEFTAVAHGTPTLQPEESQSWDAGIVLTPSPIPGLSLSVDYWDVLIRNQIIDSLSPTTILNECYDPAIALTSACGLITRRAGTGGITIVDSPNVNFGWEHAQGIDFDLAYAFGARSVGIQRPATFVVRGSTQYLMHDFVVQSPGTEPQDQAQQWQPGAGSGYFGKPRWKALLDIDYAEEGWSVKVTERYVGGITALGGTPGTPGNNAPGVFYTDLAFTWLIDGATVTVGVDNLLDKSPPFLDDGSTNSLTDIGYDYVGRFVYLKLGYRI